MESQPQNILSPMQIYIVFIADYCQDKMKTNEMMHVVASHLHLHSLLTLNGPIATKVVCFFHLLKCLSSIYGKQCGSRSDCSYRVHAVFFYT